jgi:hypothetical protein
MAGRRKNSKWPNRSQFCSEAPFRIVRTRLRQASSESAIFSGLPAASRAVTLSPYFEVRYARELLGVLAEVVEKGLVASILLAD